MATSTGTPAPAAGPLRSADREWRGSDDSCRIMFSVAALERMRFECSRSMNGPGRQGVGGVLLGTRLGSEYRVDHFQLIPCEHAQGPDFRLSPSEESRLSRQLETLRFGPESKGLQLVGWFVSHPRGDLRLTAEDEELHEKFFGPDQLALVIKPDRLGEMEMAVHHGASAGDAGARFVEPLLSVAPDASSRPERRTGPARRRASEVEVSMANTQPTTAEPITEGSAQAGRRVTLAVVLAVLLAAVGGGLYWNGQRGEGSVKHSAAAKAPIEMLSLHISESGGQFYISWNGQAQSLQRASKVLLLIQDGDQLKRFQLSITEAVKGVQVYRRLANEVKVTLEVHAENGEVVEESTHFASTEFTTPSLLRITPETSQAEVLDPAAVAPSPIKY